MKLLVEPKSKKECYLNIVDGIIIGLRGYSVGFPITFTMKEIRELVSTTEKEIFVSMNRNFFNSDIPKLEKKLKEFDLLGISGVFFYDLAVLELKKEYSLSLPLIWDQTHMVNNYETCNYYNRNSVSYALLSKEITLEEILEIQKNTSIKLMVEVVSKPRVAFTRRALLTNYYKNMGKKPKRSLSIHENVSSKDFIVEEGLYGTSFLSNTIMNGTVVIKDLYQANVPYIIMREYGIPSFEELLYDTISYIKDGCRDESYVLKYQSILGSDTNFFFNKTIYKVKKS